MVLVVFEREWNGLYQGTVMSNLASAPSLACIQDYSIPLASVFIGSCSYSFQGGRWLDWTFSSVQNVRFVVPLENLEGISSVPNFSPKQSVEYLTHATLQWTTDDIKITFDSNSLVVNTRQAIVIN